MVEMFIFPAVLIGVTRKACKIEISQLPRSLLLASLISKESGRQPSYFNRIFSFKKKNKIAETIIDHLETCHFFLLTPARLHKFVNCYDMKGKYCERKLHDN